MRASSTLVGAGGGAGAASGAGPVVDGDTVFPPIDPEIWYLCAAEDFPAGEKETHATRYAVYERRAAVH